MIIVNVTVFFYEDKQIGLSPIKQKATQIAFSPKCNYQEFTNAIKHQFPFFNQQQYLIFLPNLGGLDIASHNFKQFLQALQKDHKLYSQIHIQLKALDTQRIHQSANQQTNQMATGPESSSEDQKDKKEDRKDILKIVLPQQYLDNFIGLQCSDQKLMKNMNILRNKQKQKPPNINQLEEQIATLIINIFKNE